MSKGACGMMIFDLDPDATINPFVHELHQKRKTTVYRDK